MDDFSLAIDNKWHVEDTEVYLEAHSSGFTTQNLRALRYGLDWIKVNASMSRRIGMR